MHDPLVVAWEIHRPWPKDIGLAQRQRYWPAVVTVWHREPGGRDSGEVCKHTRRVWDEAARKWRYRPVNGWRFHVHHYRLQIHPYQVARRWLLTRCSWCGGRSRKGDRVDVSHQWDGPGGRWWRGEPGLFHHDCSSVQHAHGLCFCAAPVFAHHGGYGTCEACGKLRAWQQEPDEADRLLAALPHGSRITAEVRPLVEAAWRERAALREAQP